jgi:hypothetical protein
MSAPISSDLIIVSATLRELCVFAGSLPHSLGYRKDTKSAKVALGGRNDDQGRICASTYYSEKERKHVADFFGRDIFFTTPGRNIGRSLHFCRLRSGQKG